MTATLTDADAESVREVLRMSRACKQWAWEDTGGGEERVLRAVGCRECLVNPARQHADGCMVLSFEGGGSRKTDTMTLSCHVDGKRKLSQAEVRRLRAAFSSMLMRRGVAGEVGAPSRVV